MCGEYDFHIRIKMKNKGTVNPVKSETSGKSCPWNYYTHLRNSGIISPRKVILVAVLLPVITIVWAFHQATYSQMHIQVQNTQTSSNQLFNRSRTATSAKISAKFTYKVPNYEPQYKNPCFHNDQGSFNCLPYAFILGMPKCGTTDLFNMLVRHPQIEKSRKEPHWWTRRRFQVRGENQRRYPLSLKTYADKYADISRNISRFPDHILVDASASTLWDMNYWTQYINYSRKPDAEPQIITANYIKQILPHSKFLVILRNPVDRLYSDYLYFGKRKPTSTYDFHNKSQNSIEVMTNCVNQHGLRSCVYNYHLSTKTKTRLRIGIYHLFLEDWFKVFPREQFLILRLEDYHRERSKYLDEISEFLKLSTYPQKAMATVDTLPQFNARRTTDTNKGGMLEETRTILTKFYQTHNDKLAELLGDSRYRWL